MMATTKMYGNADGSDNNGWVLQWRGEGTEGYSNSLRQLEFICAFRAEMKGYLQSQLYQGQEINSNISDDNDNDSAADRVQFYFRDALSFSSKSIVDENTVGEAVDDDDDNNGIYSHQPPSSQIDAYESGMQYVTITDLPVSFKIDDTRSKEEATPTLATATNRSPVLERTNTISIAPTIAESIFKSTIERCSLIRTAYRIVAETNHSYTDLANIAIQNNSFSDLMMVDTSADDDDDDDTENNANMVNTSTTVWGTYDNG